MKLKFPNIYEITQYMLIILKLLNVIQQPWYLIFIPTYILGGFVLVMVLMIGLIVLIEALRKR